MESETPQPPYCWTCERYMGLVYTMPRLGGVPQLDTFRCTQCGQMLTVKAKSPDHPKDGPHS